MAISETDSERISVKYNLDQVDKQIIKFVVNYPGIKQGAIAKELGLTRMAVNIRMQKPTLRRALEEHLATADELISEGLKLALRRMIDIVQHGSPKEAIEAGKVIAVMASGRLPGQTTTKGDKPVEGVVFRTRIGQDGIVNRSMEEIRAAEALPARSEPETIDAEIYEVD